MFLYIFMIRNKIWFLTLQGQNIFRQFLSVLWTKILLGILSINIYVKMKKYITQIKIRFLHALGCHYGGSVVLVNRFSTAIYVTVIYARYRVISHVNTIGIEFPCHRITDHLVIGWPHFHAKTVSASVDAEIRLSVRQRHVKMLWKPVRNFSLRKL